MIETKKEKEPVRGEKKKIVVVSRTGRLGASCVDHVLSLTERLGHDLVGVYVNPLPEFQPESGYNRLFDETAAENAAFIRVRSRGRVGFDYHILNGKIADSVQQVIRTLRCVEFVVLGPGIRVEDVAERVSVPVFGVANAPAPAREFDEVPLRTAHEMTQGSKVGQGDVKGPEKNHVSEQKGGAMSDTGRKKAIGRALVFGLGSVALYAAVFINSEFVMKVTTAGGFYALAPIAMVFLFSYVHGSFASAVWSALGIEASKTVVVKPVSSKVKSRKRKDTRPRATLNA